MKREKKEANGAIKSEPRRGAGKINLPNNRDSFDNGCEGQAEKKAKEEIVSEKRLRLNPVISELPRK